MSSDFNSAAYAASAASLLVSVTYILRLLEFQSDEPDRAVSIKSRVLPPSCVTRLCASTVASPNYIFFFYMAGAN